MCQFRAQRRAAISHQAPDMWSACAHSVVLVVLVAVAGAEEGPRMGDGASMHSFAAATVASAMATPSGCKVTAGVEAGAQAIGNFSDSINSTGWARLEVWAPVSGGPMVTPTAASLAAARAAGCVEGWLTHARVWQMVSNAKANLFPGGTLPTAAVLYLDSQLAWARLAAADTNRSGDDAVFWGQMAHLLAQFDGLVEGYNTVAPEGRNVSALDLYAVSSGGDLETLQKLLDVSVHGSSALTRRRYGHCSALVRALPGGSIAVAHTTWAAYWQMLRIYKVLHLGYAPGSPLSFSSYPGTLSSGDDWYAAGGTGLVVTETTNDIFNTSLLWRAADPLNAMVWHRAMIATQAASSGDAWTRLFSMRAYETDSSCRGAEITPLTLLADTCCAFCAQTTAGRVPTSGLWSTRRPRGKMAMMLPPECCGSRNRSLGWFTAVTSPICWRVADGGDHGTFRTLRTCITRADIRRCGQSSVTTTTTTSARGLGSLRATRRSSAQWTKCRPSCDTTTFATTRCL